MEMYRETAVAVATQKFSTSSKVALCIHSPTGAPTKPRPFLQSPAPVKRPNDRGVFAGFSYFY